MEKRQEKLRFFLTDGSLVKLEKRIKEHLKRGAKQVSEIQRFCVHQKNFKSTGYRKEPFNYHSHDESIRHRVLMEVKRDVG